jgi:DNA-binding MarR family transcriptional regulator
MSVSADLVARELLEVIPPIMRAIKGKWKKGPILGVTNTQFRVLMYIQNRPGTSLQDVAHHLGLTSPTTSTTVDDLVASNLVLRGLSTEDRRKITLTLTKDGQKTLDDLFDISRKDLVSRLSPLTAEQRDIISQGLELLRPLFSSQREYERDIR